MRLILSSYRAGRHDRDLKNLVGKSDKVAVIINAKDYKTPRERKIKVEETLDYWRTIGLKPFEIDLRPYFHKKGADELIGNYGFIWLSGGNVFLLRRALRYAGVDKYLSDRARKNEIILGGESAGAIIMGPTLKFSEMDSDEDNPNFIPKGYDKQIIWEGLNLINYVPVPHYLDSEYGSELDGYIAKLEQHGVPYKTMTNDQVIIISGFDQKFLT